jgi:4-hydroxybenzoate polyprenyltransferase
VGRSAGLGSWYLFGLFAAAILMLYQQLLIRDRKPQQCFAAFLNNGWLGACVFLGILLDYVFQP